MRSLYSLQIIKNRETSESYYWVGVSDSQVCMVSEEDVLATDGAMLLFYQRFLSKSSGNLRVDVSVLEYNFDQVGVATLLDTC